LANYNLSISGVYGLGPGGGKLVGATIGDALFRELCAHGDTGITAGLLGPLFPLLGISALPPDAVLIDTLSAGCSVGADYSDLTVGSENDSRSVFLSDPGYSDSDPVPAFKAFCQGLGGTYSDEA